MEKTAVHVALFAALIAALGLIPKIDLISGVPITAQSLGIMLSGAILGANRGGAAALLFVVLTLAGLPLLAGGRGGIGLLASPTVGFIIGFPIAAYVTGYVTERLKSMPMDIAAGIGAAIGGIIVLYIPGVFGMATMLDKTIAEATLLITPFLIGDAIKAVLTGIITSAVYKARPNSVFSRS